MAANVIRALDSATGDIVIFVEDDDVYLPEHIAECVKGLEARPAYGCPTLSYFNVAHKMWIKMANRGSALCQTAFRAELIPDMRRAAQMSYMDNHFGIDRRFWQSRISMARGKATTIGIKGLPGTAGLGIGHRPKSTPGRRWTMDPKMMQLERWIGKEMTEVYRCL